MSPATVRAKTLRFTLEQWPARYREQCAAWPVIVRNPMQGPDSAEKAAMLRMVEEFGVAHYRFGTAPRDISQAVSLFALRMGLKRADLHIRHNAEGLAWLRDESQVTPPDSGTTLIPYSAKAMGWHTDGYYAPIEESIRSFILHCVSPAARGGDNMLMDTEVAVALLQDQAPQAVLALANAKAMCIPAYLVAGVERRPERYSPVISRDDHGKLLLRYTHRSQHIRWWDGATQTAVQQLHKLITTTSVYHMKFQLAANEGLISRNILHQRTAFDDTPDATRVMLRGRYLDPLPQ